MKKELQFYISICHVISKEVREREREKKESYSFNIVRVCVLLNTLCYCGLHAMHILQVGSHPSH